MDECTKPWHREIFNFSLSTKFSHCATLGGTEVCEGGDYLALKQSYLMCFKTGQAIQLFFITITDSSCDVPEDFWAYHLTSLNTVSSSLKQAVSDAIDSCISRILAYSWSPQKTL